ncbi:acetylornithine/N-succinyldiaminopimelate aminotransferase [Paucibacter oligotrophus]|uniref:Diaminobutyrate--2-oxoglutarate transaminase n=1 Tax=Roseateles oligotrophus TaxID=1769250 RepID=A0A840L8S9_9BURK|nr:acetylornithine transaminase [Roseateles oligotrophus]MBB4844984.1 acetylornithine/N-succinyldiaminopimelate aminotransferase [Roseateles oligotrophus]
MNDDANDYGKHLITITQRPELVFAQGQGAWLVDEGGKRYLDLIQGWAVNSLGHSPALLAQALTQQAQQLLNPSPAFYNRPMLELAQRLVELTCMDRVFLASSGAEANEAAIKLARRWGQKMRQGAFEIIGFEGGFHGRTLAMMSASGKPGWERIYPPMPTGFPKARLNDIESVARAIQPSSVAVMIEFVQGEAGVNLADPGFVRELRALSTERQLLLIADEVQTGVGRCGHAFAYEMYGIEPDLLTLAKGIGGGAPLSALLCKERYNCFEPGDQGGTFCGNPLMAALGLAVLNEVCRDEFLARVRQRGHYLAAGLQKLAREHGLVGERGAGLLRALVLPGNHAEQIVSSARNLAPTGLLLNAPRPNLLRLMPALNITEEEIDQGLELLGRALTETLADALSA